MVAAVAAAPADISQHALHLRLSRFNALRLTPGLPTNDSLRALRDEYDHRAVELAFLDDERHRVTDAAAEAPRDPAQFNAWFEELKQSGPGQNDPLFTYLAEEANLDEMRWFLTQEIAGEAGFDDLVALTQVKMPQLAKLELARNYWDEMGRGKAKAMHGVLLEEVAVTLNLVARPEETVWESLALANLMAGLASNRSYAFHAVGALGVVELTAPTRVGLVDQGLRRLGIAARARQYFALHATLDVKHSEDWNREVLTTLLAERPEFAQPIAEGALMRLEAGARCFARYRQELGI
jgi:hypothetical protein